MKGIFLPVLLTAAVTFSSATAADSSGNWVRWRGPEANGTAPGTKPPETWSDTDNVKWKVKIPGFGTSTPIVYGDKIFVVTAIATGKKQAPAPPQAASGPAPDAATPEGRPGGRRRGGGGGMRSEAPSEVYQFAVVCVDRGTGKVLWQKVVREQVPHEGHHRDHGFASSSPVTDGEHLYVSFGSRGIYCLDLEGNVKWEQDLGDMETRNAFGEGASPALHGNVLVVPWDHEGDDFVVGLDKGTGKELWRQQRNEPTSWSTPLVVEHGGKAQVVLSATNRIRSYELETGKQIWECGGMTTNTIPTPVTGFGNVYAISGFRGAALLAIELGRTGDLTGTDAIKWQHAKGTPYVPSALLSEDRLYFFSGNTGTLSCFDAKNGKPHYEMERINDLLGGVYASPVAADGKVYLLGRDGKMVVIKDSPKLETLATNKLEDRFDASPAIVGENIFLRGHEYLYCLGK